MRNKIIAAYTREAANYDYSRYEDPNHPSNLRLVMLIKDIMAKCLVGNSILELAAGTGYWGKYLTGMGYNYSGIELTEAMIQQAWARGLNVQLGNVEDTSAYPNKVSNIICIKSFTFFPNPLQVLANCRNALDNDGRLILFYNNKYNWFLGLYSIFRDGKKVAPYPEYERRYSWQEMKGMLRQAGFKILLIKDCVNFSYRFIPKRWRNSKLIYWIDNHMRNGWTTCIVAIKAQ